jgi:proteic killer suppression protein
VIRSFKDKLAERLWLGDRIRRLEPIAKVARRRLDALNAARDLRDLSAIPGHRLEILKGGRKGQFSIRINDQWRICFRWTPGGAEDVEIVDYHG